MEPPERRVVVGVNVSVTGTEDLPTSRSDAAMLNNTDLTCVNIPPDAAGSDASGSPEVLTTTEVEPAVAEPI
jgi:hypothetical protein